MIGKLASFENAIFIVLGIFLGFCLAKAPIFTFKTEFNLSDLVGYVLTLVLALFVSLSLQSWITSFREEKNLLINDIREIEITLTEISKMFRLCHQHQVITSQDRTILIDSFRQLANQFYLLEETLGICTIDCPMLDSTQSKYYEYKAIITNFPNSRLYPIGTVNQERIQFRELRLQLREAIIAINKA